ncbi:hypothetical protein FOA52_001132 [Chlamydomonas sp. UWO 241]|nr:hypothetical protein FOA52_001132 [Chlamydomonas sp. UWO 241]
MDGVDRYASGSAYHPGTESYTFFWGGGAGPSAGIAILVRSDLVAALQPAVQADGDGRLMVMDIVWGGGGVGGGGAGAGGGGAGRLRLINAYLPASQPNRPAVQAAFIEERIRPHAAGQQHLVLAGDFNFVESPRDRARSEGPLEWRDCAPTAAMAAMVEDAPLRDAYRLLHPVQRGYTFSAYNAQARLDRFYVSPALVPRVFGCDAGESGGSDHRVVALHLTPLVPEARGPGRPLVRALFWADRDLADGFRAWFGQQAAEAPTHSHAELMRWWQAFKPRLAREARRLDCDLGRRRDAVSVEVTRLRADLKRARAAVEAGRDGLAELAELYALQRRLDVAVQRYALAPPPCAVLAAVRTHSPRVPQAVADAAGAPAITPAEVRAAAMHSKPGTAPGPDGIPVDVWRKLGEPAFVLLAAVFTAVGATEQTAFLADRHISDNICLTQMLPGLLAANSAEGVGPTGAALALLDFRKAYDTIDRGFLLAVMEAVGVGGGVLAWTRTILTHTCASAEVNEFISAPRQSVGPDPPAELPRWASSVPGGFIGECMGPAVTAALMPGPLQRMRDGVQALGPVARIPGRVLTAELWGAEAPLWANPLLQLELPAAQRAVDWRKPPGAPPPVTWGEPDLLCVRCTLNPLYTAVAVVLAALPTAWVEAAAGGAALTVLRPLRQFSPLPQEGERAAVVEILRLVGWQLPGIITPAGWRRGRPGLRSTAARPAPQPAAAGGGAAGEPRWVGFAHVPGVVGKLTCKLAVALQLRAVVDERRVRRAATVEAALALDHGPHGGPRASDVQVCAGLRGLEAAVPALWRVPLLNARKEPIWRLWFGVAQLKARLGMLPQAHACDNLLELPDSWAMMKSSVAMLLALALASGACVDARFGRGLLEAGGRKLQSAPVYPPATATATAVAIAEAVASGDTSAAASADVEVTGSGKACASATAAATATAKAVATASASAFASDTNDCAEAIAAAEAQAFQEKIATATATASADACSTGGKASAAADAVAVAVATATATAYAAALTEVQGACGCCGASPASPDVSPSSSDGSPSSPGVSPSSPDVATRKCNFWVQKECCTDWTPGKITCNSLGSLGFRYTLVSTDPPTWRDKFFMDDCMCEHLARFAAAPCALCSNISGAAAVVIAEAAAGGNKNTKRGGRSGAVQFGVAQLGMLSQAHTCDNLLELPDFWASLLHTRGLAGNAGAVPPGQLDELKRE